MMTSGRLAMNEDTETSQRGPGGLASSSHRTSRFLSSVRPRGELAPGTALSRRPGSAMCRKSSPLTRSVHAVILPLLLLPALSSAAADLNCTYLNVAHTVANCSGLGWYSPPYSLHHVLMSLDLSSNNLIRLAGNRFLPYKYLKELYLRNNSMQELHTESLNGLHYLQILDLTNNRLGAVPIDALAPVAGNLEYLSLAGNRIYEIPPQAFVNLSKLKSLDLMGNSIHWAYLDAFRGLISLQVLKLSHNALKKLPPGSFDDFPKDKMQMVQLYDNRWFCDCQLRWLRRWMNATDPSVWNVTGYTVRCDGPAIVRDATLDSRPLDELACKVQMKTSGATRELKKGADTSLICKYSSVPEAEATWLKNSDIIETSVLTKNSSGEKSAPPAAIAVVPSPLPPRAKSKPSKYKDSKFRISTRRTIGLHNELTQISELHISDFRYEDIARYKCFVQNIRGAASTEYRLTLEGVAFDSVTASQPSERVAKSGGGVDTRSVVIAIAVVFGIVLLVAIGVLIFCSVNRMQKRKREKREAIEETVKQHFIENSELVSHNGDASGVHDTSKSLEDRLDGNTAEDQRSFSNNTNDSAATAVKRPFDLSGGGGDDADPPYIFQQPGSPFNNGNTYVSFGSELTDPGEFAMLPMGTLGRGGGGGGAQNSNSQPRHPSSSRGYESSHAGSGTPLLDRNTPSVMDSDEPIEDYAQYPVYDSLTNTLQRPNGETSSVYGVSLHGPLHRGAGEGIYGGSLHNGEGIYGGSVRNGEGIYGGSLHQGEGIYGGSLQQYPHQQANGEGIYSGSVRNGAGGRSSPGMPRDVRASSVGPRSEADPAKRLSSFNYPPTNSPMPRTPTNARPTSTLPAPIPRYANHPNGGGGHSPRQYHRSAAPESPSPHNRTMPAQAADYRDYRDMRYPPTTPPAQRMNASQKSMSVGNLGYYQPISHPGSAPRKPPRLFQSREYMELPPQEREQPLTAPVSMGNGEYITSPEAQQYGQSYGITPGTPV